MINWPRKEFYNSIYKTSSLCGESSVLVSVSTLLPYALVSDQMVNILLQAADGVLIRSLIDTFNFLWSDDSFRINSILDCLIESHKNIFFISCKSLWSGPSVPLSISGADQMTVWIVYTFPTFKRWKLQWSLTCFMDSLFRDRVALPLYPLDCPQ